MIFDGHLGGITHGGVWVIPPTWCIKIG